MEIVRRFRSMVLRYAIIMIAFASILSVFISEALARGVLMGGLAGLLAFWFLVRNAEFANGAEDGVKSRLRLWLMVRMVWYSAVLFKAYGLDTAHCHGLIGAVAGLLLIRVAVSVVGITGWDLQKTE